MGFLEFKDKIKSLEMFLTDKGKERMLNQNGLGLSELIQRFTFYDDDWDYRRTSQYWQDGVSPQPQNTTTPGSTQTWVNDLGLQIVANLQEHFAYPLTATTEWFDMTDVRGHRGRPILDCHAITGTSSMRDCTNIYTFYDVTSTSLVSAESARDAVNVWVENYKTVVNTGWTGMVFHIPVYGERWVNSSYYPWHGELDTCSYNLGGSNDPNSVPYSTYSTPGENQGMLATNTVYGGDLTSLGLPFYIDSPNGGIDKRIYGVTGLWNGTASSVDNYPPSFGKYPPGTLTNTGTTAGLRGNKMEWQVTGCTMIMDEWRGTWVHTQGTIAGSTSLYWNLDGTWGTTIFTKGDPYPECEWNNGNIHDTIYNVSFTATPYTTYWSNSLLGTTWSTPYVQSLPHFHTHLIYSGMNYALSDAGDSNPAVRNLDVLCNENCCSDDFMQTGSLFGGDCGCNPFRNQVPQSTGTTIVIDEVQNQGYMWGISDPHHALSASPLTYIAITGDCTFYKFLSFCPCQTFKGGDRNVLVINMTDNSAIGVNPADYGGVMPLGEKSYYGKGVVNIGIPDNSTISTWTNTIADGMAKGYHGGGSTTAGDATFAANLAYRMGWDDIGVKSYGDDTTTPYSVPGIMQPTPDWQYSQDLFLRTRVFYDSFRGFSYPVVKLNNLTSSHFLQHIYGAVMGKPVPYSGLPEPNLTIYGTAASPKSYPTHPFMALTGANPYSEIIPVSYSRPPIPYGPTISPAWGNDGSMGCAGQMVATTDILGNSTCVESIMSTWDNLCPKSGLKNYGWDLNAEVGCSGSTNILECDVALIYSLSGFQQDLTSFITGTTHIYVGYECTYCQCLPAVFINRVGPPNPVIVVGGCPCPDGTYSPACCPIIVIPVVEEIGCGPLPLLSSQVRMSTYGGLTASNNVMLNNVSNVSNSLFSSKISNDSTSLPSMNSLQMLDNVGGDGNWGEMQRDLATTTNRNARTGLVVEISAILQPFTYQYNEETHIDYDIIFNSETYIGNTKVVKGQVKFKWIIQPGLVTSRMSIHSPELTPCREVQVSEVNKKVIGGDLESFIFLNGNRDIEQGHYWKYEKDEYCVTLAVEIDGKIQIKTKRIRIVGNKFNGWIINWLST